MLELLQDPGPGTHRVMHRGDVIDVRLTLPVPRPGRAWLRTNLGHAAARREEVIHRVRDGRPVRYRDWHDIPMRRLDEGVYGLTLPLLEVGRFEAKACFMASGEPEPSWPAGDNVVIKVEPADTVCANTLYTAFVRQFGPDRQRADTDDALRNAVSLLDARDYTVIPRSGTFRDLLRELDFIFDTLGFRVLQLLPIHPVPTTYARMGRFGSPFAALDYTGVDPALAEFDRRTTPLEQFRELIDGVHARSGRLFMDMPVNHTGWASRLQIEHPEWFARNADETFISPGAWGVTWEDLSKLDYTHRPLWTAIAEVFLYWCRQGVDGFRCDAGYMVPVRVWEYIVAEVRSRYPDTVFLLEGLGGPTAVVDALLTEGNLDWAYSELFQQFDPGAIAEHVREMAARSATHGLHIHYAETHDNDRLAARSIPWADMRTALAALTAPAGGFGIANGVEWHATARIDVHGAPPLSWGNPSNQVERLRRLNALLRLHPAFHAGATIEVLAADGNGLAFRRRAAEGGAEATVDIVVNPGDSQACTVTWTIDAAVGAVPLRDLLAPGDGDFTATDGRRCCSLPPGAVRVLTADGDAWLGRLVGASPGSAGPSSPALRGEPEAASRQRRRAKVFELHQAAHGFGNVADIDADALAADLHQDPAGCTAALLGGDPPRIVRWSWPADARRVVMVPPGYALMVRGHAGFTAELRDGDAVRLRERSLSAADGSAYVIVPPQPAPPRSRELTIALAVFDGDGLARVESSVLFLAAADAARVVTGLDGAGVLAAEAYAIAANAIGAFFQVRGEWGALRSQYDALLAANLNPDYPVDRRVMLTRCRGWLVYRGYSRAIDARSLEHFASEPDGTACWKFVVPSGLGKTVRLDVRLRLADADNAVALRIHRIPERSHGSLRQDQAVRLILRPDIDDRTSHERTKAYLGPEHAWPRAVRALTDGFTFAPAPGRELTCRVEGATFTTEPEWTYMVEHVEEAERGIDPHSDLFSPGHFSFTLLGGESRALMARVVGAHAPPGTPRAARKTVPAADAVELPEALRAAMADFIVRRGGGQTVIAGYPWFLDWGRDTMICLRGLIAAGYREEARAILGEFARFESHGTLPNAIHGADGGNRDTSDAPLWFVTACADLCAAEGDDAFLKTDCGGQTLLEVLRSILGSYRDGTPNGIRMDPESGLVFSPSHFTWMDTNFPAGTPREGYPIEIQALWHAALRFLAARERRGPWGELAARVGDAILAYYPRCDGDAAGERYLSDCLHASPGMPAARAVADDALRPNQLLAITLGSVTDRRLCADILTACESLLVPGAIRSLADRPVTHPLPVRADGRLLNDPLRPYWETYAGDEDTRRKPAYHNGTAWSWLFPSYAEALVMTYGKAAQATAAAILAGAEAVLNHACLRHVPEILDGDSPHRARGCGAQAWGCTELYRALALLRGMK